MVNEYPLKIETTEEGSKIAYTDAPPPEVRYKARTRGKKGEDRMYLPGASHRLLNASESPLIGDIGQTQRKPVEVCRNTCAYPYPSASVLSQDL